MQRQVLMAGKSPLNEGFAATVDCIRCTAKSKHLSCGKVFLYLLIIELGGKILILMIDNFDSFCYNIYQYIKQLGEDIEVIRNDSINIQGIKSKNPSHIIISPGPCAPAQAGISLEAIDYFKDKLPVLGVCLGHQAIGEAFGGKVIKAIRPVHGHVQQIKHDEKGIFKDIPSPFNVTRYHSLVVEKTDLPSCLEVSAVSLDGQIMGLRHKEYQVEGVQFHPEAILTEHGHKIFRNFIDMGGFR